MKFFPSLDGKNKIEFEVLNITLYYLNITA